MFYYEPRFNGVFSIDNLSGIKDGANVINHDDKQIRGTHWISLLTLTETSLCTLTLLELNILHKKYYTKSKMNASRTTYSE